MCKYYTDVLFAQNSFIDIKSLQMKLQVTDRARVASACGD